MSEIPEEPDIDMIQFVGDWYSDVLELKKLKVREMMLRKRIFNHYFPTPLEGTNTFILPDDYQLKGNYKIDRAVEHEPLVLLKDDFREKGISVDDLVEYKPSLILKNYRALSEENKTTFGQVLSIKPGSPSLEIKPPSKKKAKGKP